MESTELAFDTEALRKTRRMLEISQKELAKRVNVTRASIISWEKGTVVPNIGHVNKLASALGVPSRSLLKGGE